MKLKLLGITMLALTSISQHVAAQAPAFAWAAGVGGTSSDVSRSVALDAAGNVYSTGSYSGTADLDPGAGVSNFTSAGSNDLFVTKFSSSGSFAWAQSIGGTGVEGGIAITLDVSGNIYVAGSFENTVDFDPGAGSFSLTSAGGYDAFILKLDNSGAFVWAKGFGSAGDELSSSIVMGGTGNVLVSGFFSNTIDFDPGAGVDNHTSAGANDVFVTQLDATGAYVWTKQIGGIDYEESSSLASNTFGDVFISGNYSATTDFDPGAGVANLTAVSGYDVFVCKLYASGGFAWARGFGGNGNDYGNGIAVDASGNVYSTGRFDQTVDFDPGAGTSSLTSAGSRDIFLSKLDSAGIFVWAKQLGGTNIDIGNSVNVDATGNVYAFGYFNGTGDFDPGAGTYSLSASATDIYMVKLSSLGTFVWAYSLGGTNSDLANGSAVDASGNIYLVGHFSGTADFDPGAGSATLTAAGGTDAFIVKLSQSTSTGIDASGKPAQVIVFPNPSNGHFHIQCDQAISGIRIVNILGELVYASEQEVQTNTVEIDLGSTSSGLYFYQLESNGKISGSGKIIVE
jgi:hypothetical protein